MNNKKDEKNFGHVLITIGATIFIFFSVVGQLFNASSLIVIVFSNLGFMISVGGIIVSVVLTQSKNNNKKRTYDQSKMEHKDCDIILGDGCLHEDEMTASKYKVCKNCGHKNTRDMKKCSVCGYKLK